MAAIVAPVPSVMSEHSTPSLGARPIETMAATAQHSAVTVATLHVATRPAWGESTAATTRAMSPATPAIEPTNRSRRAAVFAPSLDVPAELSAPSASRVLREIRST
jgi:hypothetical protein